MNLSSLFKSSHTLPLFLLCTGTVFDSRAETASSIKKLHASDVAPALLKETKNSEKTESAGDVAADGPSEISLATALHNVSVTYDDGVLFKYAPAEFSMRMKFRLQNRYSYEDYDSDGTTSDKSEFLTRRVRLRLEGHVLDPRLTYKLQFSFSRQDIDWDGSSYPNILRDANVGYQFTKNDQLIIGLAKLPGNRERVASSGRQEFVDRSLASAQFNLDRDVGVQWWHRFGETHPLWTKLSISNGQGRGSSQRDNGMNYTLRAEWLPLGVFKDGGDYFEGDLSFEETMRASLAAGYSINKKASRTMGQLGADISDGIGRDMDTFIADALIKYRGWAWSSEYFRRQTERPQISPTQTIYDGIGWNTQLSYTFRNMYATGARWATTRPENDLKNLLHEENQYSVMVSKYFDRHNVKIQADVNYQPNYRAATDVTLDNWVYRMQLEVGI